MLAPNQSIPVFSLLLPCPVLSPPLQLVAIFFQSFIKYDGMSIVACKNDSMFN